MSSRFGMQERKWLTGRRVFVLEDDVMNLAIMTFALRGYGLEIIDDRWGQFTVNRMLKNIPLDIILLDINLPRGRTGYQVFEELLQHPDLAGIPVAAVTASDPDIEMNRCRNSGFLGFIPKPINHDTFPLYVAALIYGIPIWGEPTITHEKLLQQIEETATHQRPITTGRGSK